MNLDEFVFIPRFNLQAAAGFGSSSDGERPVFRWFSPLLGANYLHADARILRDIGQATQWKGIERTRCDLDQPCRYATPTWPVYVLRLNNDLVVKRQLPPGGRAKAANESHLPFELDFTGAGRRR